MRHLWREGNEANQGDAAGSYMDCLKKVHAWDRDPGWVRSMGPFGEDRLGTAFVLIEVETAERDDFDQCGANPAADLGPDHINQKMHHGEWRWHIYSRAMPAISSWKDSARRLAIMKRTWDRISPG